VLSGTPVTFSVRASGTSPLRYQWQRNGADISGATAADYTIASPAASDDGARFRATVSNDFGSVLSNEAILTVTTVQGPTTATFLRTDTTTRGTWRGTYGNQGWALAGESSNLPAYAQLTLAGQSTWTWTGSTTDVRALQRPTSSDRFASTWYAGGSFTLDLALTDGSPHQVALYAVDWDTTSRVERIDVFNASTNALLDSRTLANFNNGQYLIWSVAGHVVFRVTLAGGVNPIVSGFFIDGNSGGGTSSAATFLRTDTTTRGTWRGTYGNQGWALAGDSNSLPAYAQLTLAGQSTWTWTGSTTDVRALQRPTGTDRFASTWYAGGSFALDLALTDGSPHQVALHAVDWDIRSRAERIDVLDAATNALLDSRTLANFDNGQYLVWTVTGHVVFRVTLTGGVNPVISGLFIDGSGGGGTSSAATFLRTDTTTGGTWRGAYGNQGWSLATESNTLPAYAQFTPVGQSVWTWAGSTTDVRALQRPTTSDRFAATWFAVSSFTLDLALTDGSSHQVALYAVDWDTTSRAERIDVLDAATSALLDSRTLASFNNGQYLVWTITGHVVFRVTLTGGVNPIVSGLFLD
jgi:hypothetical protein